MKDCQLVVKTDCDGIGNVLKGYITALSISPTSKLENNPDYIYGNYNTILDSKHIYTTDDNVIVDKVYTCRLLILKEEEQLQNTILNEFQDFSGIGNSKYNSLFCSKLIDWNYDSNKIHPTVSNRIFHIIDKLEFLPVIKHIFENISKLFTNKITLGISVRTWKLKHESNINRPYDFETYKNTILQVIKMVPEINYIVLSIDNEEYIDEYINLFKNNNLSYLILNKNNNINDLQYAAIKMLVLAKCNYFIGNRISTFSELVFWFSRHKTKVYTVF